MDNIVFLDIETIPGMEMPKLEDIKAPANYTKPETILKYQQENQLDIYKKQALNSMQGRIVCIGWGYNGEIKIESGETEEETIQNFTFEMMSLHNKLREPLHFCGWNISTFDLPWLWRKAIQYGQNDLRKMIPKDNRALYTDLMRVWAADYKDYVSLDNCAKFLGIEHEGGKGSDVYDWWQSGDLDALSNHCHADIQTTIEIYKRIYGGE